MSAHRLNLSLASLSARVAGAAIAAAFVLSSACGGQEGSSSFDSQGATLASTATTNFVLSGSDSQTTPPFLTCTTATQTITVDSGTLAVGDRIYTAVFNGTVTQNGTTTPQTYQDKGQVSVSGNTYSFRSPGVGTFTGTLSNGTLTVGGYTYCGATHTLVYQQQ
ncbi:MAG: hypothetical protein ACJ79H_22425 [Myxococcales bacterium]